MVGIDLVVWVRASLALALASSQFFVEETCLFPGSVVIAENVEVCAHVTASSELLAEVRARDSMKLCMDFSASSTGMACEVPAEWRVPHIAYNVPAVGPQELVLGVARDGVFEATKHVPFVKRSIADATLAARSFDAAAPGGYVLGLYLGHDASVALVRGDGFVEEVLELERLVETRYFGPDPRDPKGVAALVRDAVAGMLARCGLGGSAVGRVAWARNHQAAPYRSAEKIEVRNVLRELFGGAFIWHDVDHQPSHALLGLYDSPFTHPLVLTFDGGGNDGYGAAFAGDVADGAGRVITRLANIEVNLGVAYMVVSLNMPEVAGDFGPIAATWLRGPSGKTLSLAGKTMGYAGLGDVRPAWVAALRALFRSTPGYHAALEAPGAFWARLNATASRESERDLAASLQAAFEAEVFAILDPFVLGAGPEAFDGIVLSGGCALNVVANAAAARRYHLRVHAPAAANDGGLAVGAAWHIAPPRHRWPLQHAGPELFDASEILRLVAGRCPAPASPAAVAAVLAGGAIVGVARGRAEFGPRALGHRSLLAVPDTPAAKDALNRVKHRQSWRPCAPAVLDEDVLRVFEDVALSPTMSLASRLTPEAAAALPAIAHVDGTARPQVVYERDDPWLYALLKAVKARTGWGVVINTSFNVRGRPILNRAETALAIFDESPDVGALVLGDHLLLAGACASGLDS